MARRSLRGFARNRSFGANVTKLLGGTVVVQGLAVALSPILTRIFSPTEFGVFAIFAALFGVLLEVSSLRYEVAIPLPKSSREAFHVAAVSGISLLLVLIVITLAAVFFSSQLAAYLDLSSAALFLVLLLASLAIAGANKILQYWIMRERNFGIVSSVRIAQGTVTVSSQLVAGLLGLTQYGLIVGHTLGQFSGNVRAVSASFPSLRAASSALSISRLRVAATKYRNFPLFSTWTAAANSLSVQAPVLLLTFYFSPALAGLYALSARVLQTPMNMLGSAVSQVYYVGAASQSRERLKNTTETIFVLLVRVGLPLMLMLGLSAPTIFSVVFGAEWETAGRISQALTPWLFFVFISSPLSMLPSLLGFQKVEMAFQLSMLIMRVLSLVLGATLGGFPLAIILFAGTSALWWSVFMFWNLSMLDIGWSHTLRVLLKESGRAVIFLIPYWIGLAIQLMTHSAIPLFVGCVMAMGAVGYAIIKSRHSRRMV